MHIYKRADAIAPIGKIHSKYRAIRYRRCTSEDIQRKYIYEHENEVAALPLFVIVFAKFSISYENCLLISIVALQSTGQRRLEEKFCWSQVVYWAILRRKNDPSSRTKKFLWPKIIEKQNLSYPFLWFSKSSFGIFHFLTFLKKIELKKKSFLYVVMTEKLWSTDFGPEKWLYGSISSNFVHHPVDY
jgi:hypothetical protein